MKMSQSFANDFPGQVFKYELFKNDSVNSKRYGVIKNELFKSNLIVRERFFLRIVQIMNSLWTILWVEYS